MREPSLEVAIGFKGVGKTYTTNQIINKYIVGDSAIGRRGRPVLVFDANAEYEARNGYVGYKAIDFDVTDENEYSRASEIRKIKKPGKYRILPFKKNRQPMTPAEMVDTCMSMCRYYRNGMLVLEDINKYMQYGHKQDFVGTLIGLRHLGVDLIIHFQSLRAVSARIMSNWDYLRWHKISDTIKKFEQRIDNPELFGIAECIVNNNYQTNTRYYLWINVLQDKLINVSNDSFTEGCLTYLSQNPKHIRNMLNETNIDGSPIYKGRAEAIKGFIDTRYTRFMQ